MFQERKHHCTAQAGSCSVVCLRPSPEGAVGEDGVAGRA